jgi:hypothetical protein
MDMVYLGVVSSVYLPVLIVVLHRNNVLFKIKIMETNKFRTFDKNDRKPFVKKTNTSDKITLINKLNVIVNAIKTKHL